MAKKILITIYLVLFGVVLAQSQINNGTAEYEKGYAALQAQNYTEAVKWYKLGADKGNDEAMRHMGWAYEYGRGVTKSYPEAVNWYKKAADKGNVDAMISISLIYREDREGITKNFTEVTNWLKKAANKGNTTAMYSLGVIYQYANGVAQDETEAKIWYQKAADNGHESSKQALQRLASTRPTTTNTSIAQTKAQSDNGDTEFQKGSNAYKAGNYTEAMKLLKQSAEKGHTNAMLVIGMMYYEGKGFAQNDTEAKVWFQKSADKGNEKAKEALKSLAATDNGKTEFEYGSQLEQGGKINEAINYYTISANKGNVDASFNLGLINYKRRAEDKSSVFEKDNKYIKEAVKWFQKAGNLGDAEALYNLGRIHYLHYKDNVKAKEYLQKATDNGSNEAKTLLQQIITTIDNGDTEYRKAAEAYKAKSYPEVMKLLKQSADKGHTNAMLDIGMMYYDGNGVTKNHIEAMNWFKKSADKGNIDAMLNVGLMYYGGESVTKDYTQALFWLKKSAEKGNQTAIHQVGVMYAHGQGTLPLYEEAFKWLKQSADKGNINSMVEMATIYVKSYQYEEAFNLYKRVAEKGDARGMYMLGVMYKTGQGVAKNETEAKRWYQQSADKGNEKAKEALQQFATTDNGKTVQTQELKAFSDKPLNRFGKWGFKDQNGKVIVAPKYNSFHQFREGLAAISIGGSYDEEFDMVLGSKYGFIDNTGKEVIALKYESINGGFYEGLAAVKLDGKWGYIDKAGKVIIHFQYSEAFIFINGKAKVRKEGKEFFIDKTGKEVK